MTKIWKFHLHKCTVMTKWKVRVQCIFKKDVQSMCQCMTKNVSMHDKGCASAWQRLCQCMTTTVPVHDNDCVSAWQRLCQCMTKTVPVHDKDCVSAWQKLCQCMTKTVSVHDKDCTSTWQGCVMVHDKDGLSYLERWLPWLLWVPTVRQPGCPPDLHSNRW